MNEPVDIFLQADRHGQYDIAWSPSGDFVMTDTLETATLMSLTCERRAKSYEIVLPQYRRGWIGNLLFENVDHEDGCGNWLYEQKRLNSKTINGRRDESEKGLLWMIEDGIAKQIIVMVSVKDSKILTDIKIQLLDETFYTLQTMM